MEKLVVLAGGVLLIALFIETVFRIMNRFAGETKEIFRWIYMIGCGVLCVIFLWMGWKDIVAVRYAGGIGWVLSAVLIVSVVITLLLNFRKDK